MEDKKPDDEDDANSEREEWLTGTSASTYSLQPHTHVEKRVGGSWR